MAKKKKKSVVEKVVATPVFIVFFLLLISAFLFYVLVHGNLGKVSEVQSEPIAGKVLPPETGSFLGISVYAQDTELLKTTEQKVNKQFAIVGTYQAWGAQNNTFNTQWAQDVSEQQSIPLITWEPWKPVNGYDRSENLVYQKTYLLKNITQGKFDAYIKKYAIDIKNYKKKVMMRFAHEMNGNWYSWGSTFNTPDEYIAAWRHVHTIFVKEGATNVTWIWSPNALYNDPHVPYADQIEKFYPGDAYVDWVGFSAFNWAGQYKLNVWTDPEMLYSSTVAVLGQFNKPIMITETASAETSKTTQKAEWIQQLAQYLKDNQEIKGIVWFDLVDNGIDWRIDSSSASNVAFRDAFDGYFIQKVQK